MNDFDQNIITGFRDLAVDMLMPPMRKHGEMRVTDFLRAVATGLLLRFSGREVFEHEMRARLPGGESIVIDRWFNTRAYVSAEEHERRYKTASRNLAGPPQFHQPTASPAL